MEISINRKPKMNPKEILKLKSTIIEMKNSLQGFKGRFEQTEEILSELEDRTIEVTEEKEKKKRWKKSKQSPRKLWDANKQTNICIVEVPED